METVYFQIQKYYDDLSSTEQLSIDFILHYDDIENLKLKIVQESLHVSAPTIIRAVKKLNYRSFTDFKYALINFRNADEQQQSIQDFEMIIQTISNDFHRTINMIDKEKTISCAQTILNSRRIFCAGMGGSMSVVNSLNRRLKNLGFWSNDYTDASPFKDVPEIAQKDDCIIVVSLHGNEQQLIDAASACKAQGVKIIVITGFPNNALSSLSDLTLFAHQTIQDRVRLRSRLMLSVVTDILFETVMLLKEKA